MTIALALVSAALFGTGVALQQRPARTVPDRFAARFSLLVHLLARPMWVAGVIIQIAGFVMQVVALRRGSLVVVQPVITTSLLFTVALVAFFEHEEVRARDWMAILAVVVGLTGFLVLAAPAESGSANAGLQAWLFTGGFLVAAIGGSVAAGLRSSGARRAAFFGAAAGLSDAVMAVLSKTLAHSITLGWVYTFESWTPYALAAAGVVAMTISQSAYQAGRPTVSLPIITVTDPIVSSAIGVGMFGEVLRVGSYHGPGALIAAGLMLFGLVVLTRSGRVVEGNRAQARAHSRLSPPCG